ncbi:hypothetical protein RA307_30500 [Xanthobacteraceae bacterium Astr-EGSB]|uniref:hypothetical protein n=1 Tax=Astrobacterium formosum TaxID=3069710 RepID=UPI0027B78BDC|nr:hypothetical protein [Xanthobacteraceae bacterium Astr-EGSB]
MNRKRSPKRGTVQFDAIIAACPPIDAADAYWRGEGYVRANAQAFRRRDGTYTVRLVWRCRTRLVSAVTCTYVGLVMA